ncbi:MAG TPA: hypothetical protein VG892_07905, partial [Terriglobales bacterium]|nr:hypothetical protein [Terriglobales bacterium]
MKSRVVGLLLLILAGIVLPVHLAAQKRVFLAPDDHTDYFWSATDVQYRQHFVTMLDYYLDQRDATINDPSQFQSRFSADGSLWLYEYQKAKTPAAMQRLIDALKSEHISAPLNPLVITYGGVPTEGVLRSMYFSGQMERRYGVTFPIAISMEGATQPFGLSSLWAGSGAKYSWKGICNCLSNVPDPINRQYEIYRAVGPDGQGVILKWFSLKGVNDNQDLGGYAEARYPGTAFDEVTVNSGFNGFASRYPYNTIGVFGQGWDDVLTTNLNILQACKTKSTSANLCIVSSMTDFFKEFSASYGAGLPTVAASFGNEWDLSPASMAEVSARVKRSIEKLRSAESIATLVTLKNPSLLGGREASRDKAFLDMGLFFEHDFENGGPGVAGSARIAWQRQVAGEIESYVNPLMTDAASALGGMIENHGSNPRFYLFNPLSWSRSDTADFAYSGSLPVHVVDLAVGAEVPSQIISVGGTQYIRIFAQDIPSVGYKVFEIQPGAGQAFANAPTASASTGIMENEIYRITVAPRGAITSFLDKRLGLNMAGTNGGYALNDMGSGNGTLTVENAGPVSVTLVATSSGPLAHTTRITLARSSDRVAIQNEVTQNFGGTQYWRFSVNVSSPLLRHEEVGAIARARLTTNSGDYSPRNSRYDFLTLNHFADMSGSASTGLTLSNLDAYFMTLGGSTISNLDTTTPQFSVVLGASARPSNPILNQAGDSYVMQRFALQSHGAYDPAAAMRFSLEHQTPLVAGAVGNGTAYPEFTFSYLSISDPNVLLWALKPAEEGIGEGVIARVWNVASAATNFSLSLNESISAANKITHIESNLSAATITSGALSSAIAQNQLLSFRLFPSSLPPAVKIMPSDARLTEAGRSGSFTVTRTGDVSLPLSVTYTVGGTATADSDYQALPGIITIPAGSSSAVIPLVPLADTIGEPEETIIATLTPQSAYLLGSWKSAAASIIDANGGGGTGGGGGGTGGGGTGGGGGTSGPVALYPFSEGSGGTSADASGAGNSATLGSGTSRTAGKYGNAINFNGTGYVSAAASSSLDLGSTGTIEAWVQLRTLNRWNSVIA